MVLAIAARGKTEGIEIASGEPDHHLQSMLRCTAASRVLLRPKAIQHFRASQPSLFFSDRADPDFDDPVRDGNRSMMHFRTTSQYHPLNIKKRISTLYTSPGGDQV